MKDRIGWTVAQLHRLVPTWEERLSLAVERWGSIRHEKNYTKLMVLRFLTKLTPTNQMERSSFFVQVTEPGQTLSDILCQLEPMAGIRPRFPSDIIFRQERQVFRRLPNSGAVLFSVKTRLIQLTELTAPELRNFAVEARSWPEETARYKGISDWGPCALQFCDAMTTQLP